MFAQVFIIILISEIVLLIPNSITSDSARSNNFPDIFSEAVLTCSGISIIIRTNAFEKIPRGVELLQFLAL